MQFDEGELRGPVDRDEEIELALSGSNFGDVDMEIADRVSLELALGLGFAFDLGQARDPVPLEEAKPQRRARQVAGWSAAERRGSRRAATGYALRTQRRRPLPRLTKPSIWALSVLLADRKPSCVSSTW